MEKIIANDLGISVDEIRKSSWERLESKSYHKCEKAFRPKNMFIVGGNINLSLKREMGMTRIHLSELRRKVDYKIACLRKNKRNV